MVTRIYGSSDDNVYGDGDYNFQFSAYDSKGILGVVSDGTIFEIKYGKLGIWKVTLYQKGKLFDRIEICTDPESSLYSDVLFLENGVKYVLIAPEYYKAD